MIAAPNWPGRSFRLLSDTHNGDILLIEAVDRLSRLKEDDWDCLKAELAARKLRVVVLDLPTTWTMMTGKVDEFMDRIFAAINGMMVDMLAAIARKDYEDRRRRQMQGQAKAKAEGKYVGRPENKSAAMVALSPCWPRGRPTARSRKRRDAAAPLSPSSLSGPGGSISTGDNTMTPLDVILRCKARGITRCERIAEELNKLGIEPPTTDTVWMPEDVARMYMAEVWKRAGH
jgi:resolvase-like protein